MKKFKAGNILYHHQSADYSGQESFSIVFVNSDPFKENDRPHCWIQDFSVNTYEQNKYRNALMFRQQLLWIKSEYADKCTPFFKMKDYHHFIFLAIDAVFNRNDHS